MLLLYSDSSRSSVGQYRLDWVTQSTAVSGESFRAASVKYKHRDRAIDLDVGVGCAYKPCYTWRRIPWSGRLDWWFTNDYSNVIEHFPA